MRVRILLLFALLLSATSLADSPRDRLRQNAADADAEIDGQFTLRFLDAVNGQGIAGAEVIFGGQTKRTDVEGAVRFFTPLDLDHEETRNARFHKSGYVSCEVEVEFLVGAVWFNRYSISPSLSPGKIRIVLDWEASPRDLDAHLVKGNSYHISYVDMRQFEDQAKLERDDRDGFGPETITVMRVDEDATYRFSVHDYSNRNHSGSRALSDSRAHVRIYTPDGLWASIAVPRDAQGTLWHVFELSHGELRRTNRLTD